METLLAIVERAGEDNLLLVEDYIAQNAIGDGGGGGGAAEGGAGE